MIYSFIGQPESGKTTLSDLLAAELRTCYGNPVFQIDGDYLREIIPNIDYTEEGRFANVRRANTIATYLNKRAEEVIISLVNPYEKLREELKELNKKDVIEIFLISERTKKLNYHVRDFEPPMYPRLTLNTSKLNVKQCINKIMEL